MEKITQFTARLFLGHIFLIAGLNKISAYAGTQGYMEAMGVPGALLPLVMLLEIAGGLAIIIGWKARYSAILLALFSIAAAAIFHNNFDDPMQTILFMKNIAIAGGLMLLAVYGAGACSVDNRLTRNTMTTNKL
ncbi:MAG: DoxX family protein [Nitrosomonas sp.]|nr:DoxX family protein [Nitrosomonas sp.]